METPLPTTSSVATPLFPGYFPSTPSADSDRSTTVYQQDEPPLDSAGRNLPSTSLANEAAPSILGAAAGFLAGGISGALTGATLFGAAALESQGLASAGITKPPSPTPTTESITTEDQPTHDVTLGQSAIAKEIGGDTIPVAIFAGGAGAGLLEHVQPPVETAVQETDAVGLAPVEDSQVAAEKRGLDDDTNETLLATGAGISSGLLPPTLSSSASDFPASDIAEVSAGESSTVPAPVEETAAVETEGENGLSTNEKVALGAGAGLVGGSIVGSELNDRYAQHFDTITAVPATSAVVNPTTTPYSSSALPFPLESPSMFDKPAIPTTFSSVTASRHAVDPPFVSEAEEEKYDEEALDGPVGPAGLLAADEAWENHGSNTRSADASTRALVEEPGIVEPQEEGLRGGLTPLDTNPTSRFTEEMKTPIRPEPMSRFSDSTCADSLYNPNSPTSNKGFDSQRVMPIPSRLNEMHELEFEDSEKPQKIDLAAELEEVSRSVTTGSPAFRNDEFGPTTASLEFAALSSSSRSPTIGGNGFEERESKRQREYPELPLLVGGGALATAAAAGHGRRASVTRDNLVRIESSDDYAARHNQHQHLPPSPATVSSTRAVKGSPTGSPAYDSSNDGGLNPVVLSPHMKIATRRNSIGHNKLVKESAISGRRGTITKHGDYSSPTGGVSGEGSYGQHEEQQQAARTEGEAIWMGSVAQVVNDETVIRGHRPALVTIASEDRRDNALDMMSGVPDPTTPSRRAVPESSASGRKLHKERRGSNASARRSVDLAAEDGGERKEGGFWSKAFGKSSTSSVDEQRR